MAGKGKPAEATEDPGAVATVPDNGAAAVPLDMHPAASIGADWLGQSTAIEASRAAAEVQAMVVVAQRMPRGETRAWERLERSCGHRAMADVAFYDYPRGGKRIIGPTVKLAREALRCWGNAQSGVIELRRVDASPGHPGYSEVQAWAWDLETNVRESSTFIAPHVRERGEDKGGAVYIEDDEVRDIREGNASMAGRVEREMIKRILPPWFMGMAEDTCRRTLIGEPGEFGARADKCVEMFAVLGVPLDALEAERNVPRVGWGPPDLMALAVLYSEIDRHERTIADVFPGLHGRGRSAGAHLAKAAAAEGGEKADPTVPPAGSGPGTGSSTAPPAPSPSPTGGADEELTSGAELRNLAHLLETAAWEPSVPDLLAVVATLGSSGRGLPPRIKTLEEVPSEVMARVNNRLGEVIAEESATSPTAARERLVRLAEKTRARWEQHAEAAKS